MALLALAALAGCGGSDDDEPAAEGLPAALADVSWTGDGPVAFSWVDTARLRDVAGLPSSIADAAEDTAWRNVVGVVAGEALQDPAGSDYGFDPMSADRTIALGTAPQSATRYDGVDAESVRSALEDLGYEDSGDFLTLGGEGEVVEGSDEFGTPMIGVNRVAFDGDSVAFGGYEAPVAAALDPGERPLANEPGFDAMAECLGSDSLAATIRAGEGETGPEVSIYGIGVREPAAASEPPPEVVCAVGGGNGSLDRIATCMKNGFAGTEFGSNRPYSDLLGPAQVEQGETNGTPWARALFPDPPGDAAGTVFNLLATRALAGPLGADPFVAAGSNATAQTVLRVQRELDCAAA